jgi:hypothetical protein
MSATGANAVGVISNGLTFCKRPSVQRLLVAFVQKSFSFTPGFSPVLEDRYGRKPFQRFSLSIDYFTLTASVS